MRYVEHRLRVTLQDGRVIIGTFLAFDKHLNLVLSEAEEFRTLRRKGDRAAVVEERQEKRALGLIILRGENVVSLAVEGPPPPTAGARLAPGGPGFARGAGRGGPVPAPSGGPAVAKLCVPTRDEHYHEFEPERASWPRVDVKLFPSCGTPTSSRRELDKAEPSQFIAEIRLIEQFDKR